MAKGWGLEGDFDRQLHRVAKSLEEIRSLIYTDPAPVEVRFRPAHKGEMPGRADTARFGGKLVSPGFVWGKPWDRAFFLVKAVIPEEFTGRAVALRLDFAGEAVAYMQGVPVQGLDANRDDFLLSTTAASGEKYEVLVEVVSVGSFGQYRKVDVKRAELVLYHQELMSLYYDLHIVRSLANALGREDPWARRLAYIGNKCVDVWRQLAFKNDDRRRARDAKKELAPAYEQGASAALPELHLVGHAHIDVAWRWPLEETVRKCSRSFSTVLRYLGEYPDYYFSQSQAALYKIVKQHFPALFEGIKEQVASRKWEVLGGMWVESDCNITGSEALVRQFLYGRRFFRKEFGVDVDTCWLPDTFGFPASLPQVLRRSGIKYFSTAKIRWNQYTDFPHTTFQWEGIDGSKVLSHILWGSYNGKVFPDEIIDTLQNFRQADRSPAFLLAYGYGDGGGGPTRGMIERTKRVKNLFGLPKAKTGFIRDFFRCIDEGSEDLPSYRGELYLEMHRGTLTSQAETKRNNRKAEIAMRRLETLQSILLLLGEKLDVGELAAVRSLWETLLTLQFHDILPGSGIRWVYKDADRMYEELFKKVKQLETSAVRRVASQIDRGNGGKSYIIFNYLGWTRGGLIEIPIPDDGSQYSAFVGGEELVTQEATGENGRLLLIEINAVPAVGYAVVTLKKGEPQDMGSGVNATPDTLANEILRVSFNKKGRIESFFDRRFGVEVLEGEGNLLQLFIDDPVRWEAWDVDEDFPQAGIGLEADSLEVIETGPVRAALRMHYKTGDSEITQDVRIFSHLPWVEFDTRVDWKERKRLLKAAFPAAVHPEQATYEVQFGAVQRSTTRNTLKERAQFEVPAQRWADLSRSDYGVSLLNDCKYGYDVKDNVLRLSLLRGPERPDPEADIGEHRFSYALFPHKGDWRKARTVRAGIEFNIPLAVYPVKQGKGGLPSEGSFIGVEDNGVVLECVKPAEDGNGIIVRLYEAHGEVSGMALSCECSLSSVKECNLMEEDERDVPFSESVVNLPLEPFEIKTLRLVPG